MFFTQADIARDQDRYNALLAQANMQQSHNAAGSAVQANVANVRPGHATANGGFAGLDASAIAARTDALEQQYQQAGNSTGSAGGASAYTALSFRSSGNQSGVGNASLAQVIANSTANRVLASGMPSGYNSSTDNDSQIVDYARLGATIGMQNMQNLMGSGAGAGTSSIPAHARPPVPPPAAGTSSTGTSQQYRSANAGVAAGSDGSTAQTKAGGSTSMGGGSKLDGASGHSLALSGSQDGANSGSNPAFTSEDPLVQMAAALSAPDLQQHLHQAEKEVQAEMRADLNAMKAKQDAAASQMAGLDKARQWQSYPHNMAAQAGNGNFNSNSNETPPQGHGHARPTSANSSGLSQSRADQSSGGVNSSSISGGLAKSGSSLERLAAHHAAGAASRSFPQDLNYLEHGLQEFAQLHASASQEDLQAGAAMRPSAGGLGAHAASQPGGLDSLANHAGGGGRVDIGSKMLGNSMQDAASKMLGNSMSHRSYPADINRIAALAAAEADRLAKQHEVDSAAGMSAHASGSMSATHATSAHASGSVSYEVRPAGSAEKQLRGGSTAWRAAAGSPGAGGQINGVEGGTTSTTATKHRGHGGGLTGMEDGHDVHGMLKAVASNNSIGAMSQHSYFGGSNPMLPGSGAAATATAHANGDTVVQNILDFEHEGSSASLGDATYSAGPNSAAMTYVATEPTSVPTGAPLNSAGGSTLGSAYASPSAGARADPRVARASAASAKVSSFAAVGAGSPPGLEPGADAASGFTMISQHESAGDLLQGRAQAQAQAHAQAAHMLKVSQSANFNAAQMQ